MTVQELMEKLQDLIQITGVSPDAEVHVEGCDCTAVATGVEKFSEGSILITRD